MPIAIEILNLKTNDIFHSGFLTEEELTTITDFAAKEGLDNILFIDYIGETIFNSEQIISIKYEIEILRKHPDIRHSLKIIETAINSIPKMTVCYLRFSGE